MLRRIEEIGTQSIQLKNWLCDEVPRCATNDESCVQIGVLVLHSDYIVAMTLDTHYSILWWWYCHVHIMWLWCNCRWSCSSHSTPGVCVMSVRRGVTSRLVMPFKPCHIWYNQPTCDQLLISLLVILAKKQYLWRLRDWNQFYNLSREILHNIRIKISLHSVYRSVG